MAVSVTAYYDSGSSSWWSKLTLNSFSCTRSGNTVTVTIGWATSKGHSGDAAANPASTWAGFQYVNGSASTSSSAKHEVSGTSGTYTYTFSDTKAASHSGSFNYYTGLQPASGYGTNEEYKTYT